MGCESLHFISNLRNSSLTHSASIQAHAVRYPVLAKMAQDYLACSGTSCAPERMFSRAADICACGRGSLVALTIERLVSTSLWLVEGISLGEDFKKVMDVLAVFAL